MATQATGVYLIFNELLKPVKNPKHYSHESLLKCISEQHHGNCSDVKKTALKVVETNIPYKRIYFKNFFEYIRFCWANHLVYHLRPEDLLFAFFCTVSKYILNHAESFRKLFSKKKEGKQTITLNCNGKSIALRLPDILEKVNDIAPINVFQMLPDFSTDTVSSRMARISAFAEMISPYYCYMMYCCGIRGVRITGTPDDWTKLLNTIQLFQVLFGTIDESNGLERYFVSMRKIISKIYKQVVTGEPDSEWLKRIYINTTCGSGHQEAVSGWWCKVNNIHWREDKREPPMPEMFPSHITSVLFTIVNKDGDEESFIMHYGLHSGIIVNKDELKPSYNYVVNKC